MKTSRLSMPPEQIEALWNLCDTDPAKVEEMFTASAAVIKKELETEKAKLDRLIQCSEKIKVGVCILTFY